MSDIYLSINRIIGMGWNEVESAEFDKDAREFVETFLFEHYSRVRNGLLDQLVPVEERERMFRELLAMINDPKCDLYKALDNCISLDEKAVSEYINDVFKLQAWIKQNYLENSM